MKLRLAVGSAVFLGLIVLANYTTTRYGMVPVGFGLTATFGTYFAGATFVVRDSLQDWFGRRVVVALIAAGALLSVFLAAPVIAVASGVAFLVSETADLIVYTPLRRRGYIRAAVASNVAGSFVDSVLFLALAGFPVWLSVPGQMAGKLALTLAAVLIVGGARAVLRKPERA